MSGHDGLRAALGVALPLAPEMIVTEALETHKVCPLQHVHDKECTGSFSSSCPSQNLLSHLVTHKPENRFIVQVAAVQPLQTSHNNFEW